MLRSRPWSQKVSVSSRTEIKRLGPIYIPVINAIKQCRWHNLSIRVCATKVIMTKTQLRTGIDGHCNCNCKQCWTDSIHYRMPYGTDVVYLHLKAIKKVNLGGECTYHEARWTVLYSHILMFVFE